MRLGAALRALGAELRAHPRVGALALALLVGMAYFVGPPAWNQNSRLALTRALVEQRGLAIDDWHVTTGDKSWRAGHFYSDKAPGVSLLATLPYAGFYLQRQLTGGELPEVRVEPLDPATAAANLTPDPDQRQPGDALVYNRAHLVALWLCRMVVVSLPSLLAVGLFYLVMRREFVGLEDERSRRLATGASLIWVLATPAFGYACGFYGHQLTAALLFAAFALVVLVPSSRGLALLVGSLLGWAVLAEYTAAGPVLALVLWASWRRGLRFAAAVTLGGLPWAAVLAGYHTLAFGGPLATGYDFVYRPEFAEGMAVNYGLGAPDLAVVLQLCFGSYRGLFYLAPVLLLAVWGLGLRLAGTALEPATTPVTGSAATSAERGEAGLRRGDWLLVAAMVVYYLLLNSGYYMWDGGASLGPRHMVPALPFLALAIGPALCRLPVASLVLACLSSVQIVLITAAGPEAPGHGNPLWSYALPRLFAEAPPGTATNLGRLLGLPGPLSLLPLALVWWLLLVPGRQQAKG